MSGLLQAVSSLCTADAAAGNASPKGNDSKPIIVLQAAEISELKLAAQEIDSALDKLKVGEKEKSAVGRHQEKSGKLLEIIGKLPKQPN